MEEICSAGGSESNHNNSNSSFDENTDFDIEKNKKPCIWCNKPKALVAKQPYCEECERKAFRICTRCHRPLDNSSYFTLDDKRCNTCFRKYLKDKQKREDRKKQLNLLCQDDSDEAELVEKKELSASKKRKVEPKKKILKTSRQSKLPMTKTDSRVTLAVEEDEAEASFNIPKVRLTGEGLFKCEWIAFPLHYFKNGDRKK